MNIKTNDMTKAEIKEILIKDLCPRIPYWVRVQYRKDGCDYILQDLNVRGNAEIYDAENDRGFCVDVTDLVPYLQPLKNLRPTNTLERDEIDDGVFSSGFNELQMMIYDGSGRFIVGDEENTKVLECCSKMTAWMNEHNFDHNGLIEKGLAIAADAVKYVKPLSDSEKADIITDLCSRLPHGVEVWVYEVNCHDQKEAFSQGFVGGYAENILQDFTIDEIITWMDEGSIIKPYLRPLYTMDDHEANVAKNLKEESETKYIDWLNINHFDYRGLIERGLALHANEQMYLKIVG